MPPQLKLAEKYTLHRCSPSLLYNNLYSLGEDAFLYVSGNTVFQSSPDKKDFFSVASYSEPVINCFATFLPKYGNVVTILNQRSVDLFVPSKACVSLVYSKYFLTKNIGIGKCVTLCLCKTNTILLFIGTNIGNLIYTDFHMEDIGGSITCLTPKECTNAHKLRAITALDASYDYGLSSVHIVSGDNGGNVVLWDKDRQPYCFIPSCDSELECTTAVKICGGGNLVAVSFGNGKIILFSTATGYKSVEVCAHARWINAMACFRGLNPYGEGDLLATASEDGTVQLFNVVQANGEVAALVRWLVSIELSDVLPTGLCFQESGKTLALSCYDTPLISVYMVSDL